MRRSKSREYMREALRRFRSRHPDYHRCWMAEKRTMGKFKEPRGRILGVAIRKDWKELLERCVLRRPTPAKREG